MLWFGIILLVLAAPLLLVYFLGGKRRTEKPLWRNLGLLMVVVGAALVALDLVR